MSRRTRGEHGTALVELTWLGVLLLIPMLWIVVSVFEVQRGAFAVSAAARAAGRAYALAPTDAEGADRARLVARQALADQGLDDAALTVTVVDATAAYLQRQGLDTLADGAALRGADLGATGREVYEGGLDEERLRLTAARVRPAVQAYLREVGAYARYPGLSYDVRVDQQTSSVVVSLRAPLDLPLTVPGSPDHPSVGATGSAVVRTDP